MHRWTPSSRNPVKPCGQSGLVAAKTTLLQAWRAWGWASWEVWLVSSRSLLRAHKAPDSRWVLPHTNHHYPSQTHVEQELEETRNTLLFGKKQLLLVRFVPEICVTCSEFARPANQHPENTIKKKTHKPLRTSWISRKMCPPRLIIIQSCYFDYRIDKPFTCSRCVICVSCSVHLISTYYVRKGF